VQRLSKPKRGERRRNRRKRRQRELAAAAEAAAADAAVPEAAGEAAAGEAPVDGQQPIEKVAEFAIEEPAPDEVTRPVEERTAEPATPDGSVERPRRRRVTRVAAPSELTADEAPPNGVLEPQANGVAVPKPRRRTTRRSGVQELDALSADLSAAEADPEQAKPRRRRTVKTREPEQVELPLDIDRSEP